MIFCNLFFSDHYWDWIPLYMWTDHLFCFTLKSFLRFFFFFFFSVELFVFYCSFRVKHIFRECCFSHSILLCWCPSIRPRIDLSWMSRDLRWDPSTWHSFPSKDLNWVSSYLLDQPKDGGRLLDGSHAAPKHFVQDPTLFAMLVVTICTKFAVPGTTSQWRETEREAKRLASPTIWKGF